MIEPVIISQTQGEVVFKDFTKNWTVQFLKSYFQEKKIKNPKLKNCNEITVVFVSESTSKNLNRDYRGIDKPTDVLSFDGDGRISLGEVVLSKSVIQKKSKASKLGVKLYIQLMVSHGLLHLLGYTHETSHKDEVEMLRLQNKLVRKVAAKLAPKHKNDFYIDI